MATNPQLKRANAVDEIFHAQLPSSYKYTHTIN